MEVEGAAEGCLNEISDKASSIEEPMNKCIPDSQPPSVNGCFDCNICLDFAMDPVVTLCGHLYCWPCIYKWLEIHGGDSHHCPVCKAFLSRDALVPLYGRGNSSPQSPEIPKRPPSVCRPDNQFDINHHHYVHHNDYQYFSSNIPPYWPMETSVFRSTAGEVIEGIAVSILPWMFRDRNSIYYSRPQLMNASANNPRLRRQEMQAEISLHQLWSFLCCLAILCLLLF